MRFVQAQVNTQIHQRLMILHHTARRDDCKSIATNGLTDGSEGYVCLTPDVWSWHDNWIMNLKGICEIAQYEVVLSYDVPDNVAAPYLVEPTIIKPGHPDYDPEIRDYDPKVDGPWLEYRMPAELVNRHFAGVAFWRGECPFDSDDMKKMWQRRFGEV
jgi:hypothetical protein